MEMAVFDPDEIRRLLAAGLPAGLRAIADALDAGDLDGRLRQVEADGFVNWRDTRAHVVVSIDLAAEVFRWQAGERIPLPPRRQIQPRNLELEGKSA